MFKRGETFNLTQDMVDFSLRMNSGSTLNATNAGTLSLSAGRSETERQVMGAYGNICDPRPHFI
jgi:hypothetical protein